MSDIKIADLKTGQKVRLFAFPENDVPEQDALILDVSEKNGMLIVETQPVDNCDDGLADCHFTQVKFIYE